MSIRTDDGDGGMTEPCETCGRETSHDVSIELKTESQKAGERRVLAGALSGGDLSGLWDRAVDPDEQRL